MRRFLYLILLGLFTVGCSDAQFSSLSGKKASKGNFTNDATQEVPFNNTTDPKPKDTFGGGYVDESLTPGQGTDCKSREQENGRIVVSNDEWSFSDTGFRAAPTATAIYAKNLATWFKKCAGDTGSFHAYSNNFSLTEQDLADTFTAEGYQWTTGTSLNFSLEAIKDFDWIYLAGSVPDSSAQMASVLDAYVKQGGNVYVAAGTGGNGLASSLWNQFLQPFGIQFATSLNHIEGVIPINSTHPIFEGVTGLYQNNGHSLSLSSQQSNKNELLVNGLFAVYDGSK